MFRRYMLCVAVWFVSVVVLHLVHVQAVRGDLARWFGGDRVNKFKHLRTYRIPFAQPSQDPPTDLRKPASAGPGLFVCGDHRTAATLEGAIVSGLDAAKAILSPP
jgi:predicted NAD/FAD-dependent oxidoreductase